MHESFPFQIGLSWKGVAAGAQNGATENQQMSLVFPKGNPIPSLKALIIFKSSTFSVDVQYVDATGSQAPSIISTYTVSISN